MIYATGGYATATVKGQYTVTTTGLQFAPAFHGQSWNDGWFAGGGFEYMIHKGALVDVILGAEYQHFDVSSKRAFNDTTIAGAPNDLRPGRYRRHRARPHHHQDPGLRLGVEVTLIG